MSGNSKLFSRRIAKYAAKLTVVGGDHIVDILDEVKLLDDSWGQQRRIAEVVGHHNRRIQRCEIQGGDRHVVVTSARLNNCSSFILLLSTYNEQMGSRLVSVHKTIV